MGGGGGAGFLVLKQFLRGFGLWIFFFILRGPSYGGICQIGCKGGGFNLKNKKIEFYTYSFIMSI